MPPIKLYYVPGACSLAPHILLHETGVSFTLKREEMTAYSLELLELNPKAKVPVLKLGEDVITENLAIMSAISNLAPAKKLLGETGTMSHIRVIEWIAWLSSALHSSAFAAYYRPHRFTTNTNPDVHAEIKQAAEGMIKDCYTKIEEKLGGGYAVGDHFTAADAYLHVFYRWGKALWNMDEYPKYTALMKAVSERESTIKALKEEGF